MDVWEEDVPILGAVAGEPVWFCEFRLRRLCPNSRERLMCTYMAADHGDWDPPGCECSVCEDAGDA